jgi:hypothetical protein
MGSSSSLDGRGDKRKSWFRPKWPEVATTLAAAAVVGFISLVFTILDNSRKDRLGNTRDQIGQLYGPLCALLSVHGQVWESIKDYNDPEEFMVRLSASIVPLSAKIEDTILGSQITIGEDEIRKDIRMFLLHSEKLKQIVDLGKEGDLWKGTDQLSALITELKNEKLFPKDFGGHIEARLKELHERENIYAREIMGLFPLSYLSERMGHDPNELTIECTKVSPSSGGA